MDENSKNMTSIKDTSTERLLIILKMAMGPDIGKLLDEDNEIYLYINEDGKLWCDRPGTGKELTGHTIAAHDAERIIRLVAFETGAKCNESNPAPNAELPGIVFQGLLPPVVSAPVFTIRKINTGCLYP